MTVDLYISRNYSLITLYKDKYFKFYVPIPMKLISMTIALLTGALQFRKHIVFLRSIFGWLVVLRIYVALAIFQSYRDLEAGDHQSLKS